MDPSAAQGVSSRVQWFSCPRCARVVAGDVLGTGPSANLESYSRTHCCHNCEKGLEHDSFWCTGSPSEFFREVELPQKDATGPPEKAHYLLYEPDWATTSGPVPALLWLHGALTFLYPETLHGDVSSFWNANPKAREFIVIAPFATRGEPLAVESDYRWKPDRYEDDIRYVDRFDEERTWECFLAACRLLGPRQVDFERLCVSGLSMGGQATWDIATRHGSFLAAAAPIAAKCHWSDEAWTDQAHILSELIDLPLRTYAVASDTYAYEWRDLQWLADRRGEQWDPELEKLQVEPPTDGEQWGVEAHAHCWGARLQLILVHGCNDGHNCWDMVYQQEATFGLFEWMAATRNPQGLNLL